MALDRRLDDSAPLAQSHRLGHGLHQLPVGSGPRGSKYVAAGFSRRPWLSPFALGAIEGLADATSSFVKLGAGWVSDRLGHRKSFVVAGYAATGVASGIIALATGWPLVLGGKLVGWLGKGIRGPL